VAEAALGGVGRRTVEQAQYSGLLQPLSGELDRLDAVVQRTFLLDDPKRYGLKAAKEMVAVSAQREAELLGLFRPRIIANPFTVEGVPSEDERRLTRDLWAALTEGERRDTLRRITKSVAAGRGVKEADVPDQTPYAMRLAQRLMQFRSQER
jgi:hypothetical protein